MLNMLEQHEFTGIWWIPDNRAQQKPGSLIYNPRSRSELLVSPCLIPKVPHTYSFTRHPDVIHEEAHGIITTGEGVSLTNLYPQGMSSKRAWVEQKYVSFDPILISQTHCFPKDYMWWTLEFEIHGYGSWFDIDPVVYTLDEHSYLKDAYIDVAKFVPISIYDENFEYLIYVKEDNALEGKNFVNKQLRYLIRIRSQQPTQIRTLTMYHPKSIHTGMKLIRIANLICNYFQLLTLSPNCIQSAQLIEFPSTDTQTFGHSKTDLLFEQSIDEDYHETTKSTQFACSYEDVSGEYERLLSSNTETWLKLGLGSLAYTLLANKPYKRSHTFSDFVTLIFELEGYHNERYPVDLEKQIQYQTHIKTMLSTSLQAIPAELHEKIKSLLNMGSEPSFRERITELIQILPIDITNRIIPKVNKYINQLITYRNKYAHGSKISFTTDVIDEISDCYHRTILLIWMLALRDLGFSQTTLVRMLQTYLRRRAHDL